jgi:restriction endonuclease S subunit
MSGLTKTKFPKSWQIEKLRNLAVKIGSGSTPRGGEAVYKSSGIPLIRSMNVHFSGFKPDGLAYIDEIEADKLRNVEVQNNDVLLNITGASIGRVTTAPVSLAGSRVNQHVCIIRPNSALHAPFLAQFLASPEEQARVMSVQVGATRQALTKTIVESWEVPIPPLSEQRRIVAEIEKQFTRLEAGVAALRRVMANLKRCRAAVLKAACDGRLVLTEAEFQKSEGRAQKPKARYETGVGLLARILTERRQNWRGRGKYKEPAVPETANLPELPAGWTWATVEQLAAPEPNSITDGPFGSNLKTEHYTDSGPRVIRLQNIGDGVFVDEYAHISKEHFARLQKHRVFANDVVIAGLGENPPRCCIVPESLGPAIVKADCIRFKPHPSVLSKFMNVALNSEPVRRRTKKIVHGVGRPRLNLGEIRSIVLPLPPLAEQTRIVAEVERRLSVLEELELAVFANLLRATRLRQSILQRAFTGNLVPQNPDDEPADKLLQRIRSQPELKLETRMAKRFRKPSGGDEERITMKSSQDPKSALEGALSYMPPDVSASDLFKAARFEREEVYSFYDAVADSAEAVKRLSAGRKKARRKSHRRRKSQKTQTPLRLHELWVKKFKNLEDYLVTFDPKHALDVILGWNGTGKSNLFEVLIAIFRDLHKWQTKNKWTPQEGLKGFRIRYEMDGRLIEINWEIGPRRPTAKTAPKGNRQTDFQVCKREEIPLPHFVFGYYSGPSNRFAELFSEAKQEHYERLLEEKSDDEATLANLLRQRRFFNAETHHAKYALLSFFYQDDPGIRQFLKKHLRIEDLESVLFVLKRPRWYRNNNPEDFWGAKGLLRPVLERLRQHSIAPMVLPQTVDDGFQENTRDHYFLLLPDKKHLQALASEYADPTSFFVALESTDFSSIIHEVRIRVRISATATKQTIITFKEMSEGEQQLLMVLGLLRFTKMSQSLVLLDEPDTHLNPHWQLGYLHLLLEALVGNASDQKSSKRLPLEELEKRLTSQVLLSTHDPLAIAGLVKENIHLLKRRDKTEECLAVPPTENPRGMGFTGILTSEMFGLRSDLDDETLSLLDTHASLVAKKTLSTDEKNKLRELTTEVEQLGFKSTSSDPYYRAYLQAIGRRRKVRDLLTKATWTKEDINALGKETDEILEEIEKEDEQK